MLSVNIIRNVDRVNSIIPAVKTFFLPIISASFPNGNRNTAEERIQKLPITHPRLIALAFRSLPMAGSARFTADPMKGVRKKQQKWQPVTRCLSEFDS